MSFRVFADRSFSPQSPAARGRRELNIDMLKRPFPAAADLTDKAEFAASMILEEHESFGDQHTDMLDEHFEEITRNDLARKSAAGDVLRGMLIRGRLQAAVFNIFMQLCRQGVCSLNALERPVNWICRAPAGTCLNWILCTLYIFDCFRVDWRSVQENWGIRSNRFWVEYGAPMNWLATMIGRSFTSLNVVFDKIRMTDQLGPVHVDSLEQLARRLQPDKAWEADLNLNSVEEWHGSGTFAFWLPENVEASVLQQGFDNAAMALSRNFYQRLERMEMHYAEFFDIDMDIFNIDV